MKWIPNLALALGLAGVAVAFGQEEEFKANPKPKAFLGKWVGTWDNTWKVQFTITKDGKGDEFAVLYEWEEKVGQPLNKGNMTGKIEKGSLVMPATGSSLIEIALFAKEANKAKAKGNFKKVRSAVLIRDK